jgi:hypothetical protein
MMADLSYSERDRDQFQPETNAQYAQLPNSAANQYDTASSRCAAGGDMPTLTFTRDYTNPDAVLVGPTIYGAGYAKEAAHSRTCSSRLRLDATRNAELWWFDNIGFGANYSDRSKDKQSPRRT